MPLYRDCDQIPTVTIRGPRLRQLKVYGSVRAVSDRESMPDIAVQNPSNAKLSRPALVATLGSRSLVLVGMMGAWTFRSSTRTRKSNVRRA
jgi:hypothetical protein